MIDVLEGDARDDKLFSAALSFYGQIAALPPGQRADIRADGFNAAFWRVLNASGMADVNRSEVAKRDLARIIAILIGTTDRPDLHEPKRGLGAAMFDARITPMTVERMLSSEPSVRREMMTRQARRMARTGPRFNVVDLARLVLSDDPERTALKISRDYYRAEYSTKSSKEGKEGTA